MSEKSEADILHLAIRGEVAKLHTSLPGTVLSYDHATQRATVQVGVRSKIRASRGGEITNVDVPPIPGVPVCFPSAAGYAITWPLSPGDPVLLVFSERSIDEWKATGNASNDAQDVRRFDLSDAIAIPGSVSPAQPIPAAGRDAAALVIQAATVKLGSSTATEGALKGTSFEAHLGVWLAGVTALVTGLATGIPATIAAAAATFQPIHINFVSQVGVGHVAAKVKVE